MKRVMPILALVMIMAIVGCSDKKTTNPNSSSTRSITVWHSDSLFWLSTVDATDTVTWKYYGFGTEDTIPITDDQALTDTTWDIAFRRVYMKSNGGISGTKNIQTVDLAAAHSPDSVDFDAVTDTIGLTPHDWIPDTYDYAIDQWYNYDMVHHTITLTNYVYTIKDAAGKYVKFTVSGLYGASGQHDMGDMIIRYVYAANGEDISGAGITDTIHVGQDTGYFDFSTGSAARPADPRNSSDWDFAVSQYDIHLNCSLFGPGLAKAYLNTDGLGNPRTDFDNISTAETQSTAYSADVAGSAFTNWYDYNENTHQVTSKGHVYLLKIGMDIYKMQITSYYYPVNGQNTSAWYTFKWVKLDL